MKLLYIAIILLSNMAFSDELMIGAFTHHYGFNAHMDQYANKINNNGDILNPLLGYRLSNDVKDEYQASTYFAGQNSLGGPMAGMSYSKGTIYGNFRIGGIIGGYLQNDKPFKQNDIKPWAVPIGDYGVMPVIGLELSYNIERTRVYWIITPALMTTAIGITF